MDTQTIFLVTAREAGIPQLNDFQVVKGKLNPTLDEGEILVKLSCISADPYLRGMIKPGGPCKEGNPMFGFVAGKVIQSRNSNWPVGTLFGADLPFQDYQKLNPERVDIWKLQVAEKNIAYGIGALGMPGSTAYGGLIDVLRPVRGETIFVSAASGAVGSLVGQLAKRLFQCRVIGSCGGPKKCAILTEELGFDHAIDYKTCANKDELVAALRHCAPEGIDMYFECVGGMHFDAALQCLRPHGRIAVCGK